MPEITLRQRPLASRTSAIAGPAICLLLLTVVLAYSRGALLALVVGLVFWFVVTPLRLRSASVLAIGGAGAAVVTAWSLSQPALTTDNASLAAPSRRATNSAGCCSP
jgi:lysylphosphatidylglycerol synthetase-like protein (DUF2156 family)